MERNGLKTDDMISLRRRIHQHAEGGFKEFKTKAALKEMLFKVGVSKSEIKDCAGTGMVVDLRGKGKVEKDGKKDTVGCVALRADMDALPIPENNPDLEYRTQTDHAHMCGHDGHMATIMAFTQVFCANRDKIPSNKMVRLLIQPAEEGPGGALPMIKEGCLDGVDEVYGYHNIPNFDEGDIRVCEGPIFASVTIVKIKITGQGGHGSVPHKIEDPITAASAVHQALLTIASRNIDSRENIVLSICQIDSGHTYNVYPDTADLKGTIRSFHKPTLAKMKKRINTICKRIAEAHDCTAEVDLTDLYPAVINHKKQTNHVIRLAKKYIGEDAKYAPKFPGKKMWGTKEVQFLVTRQKELTEFFNGFLGMTVVAKNGFCLSYFESHHLEDDSLKIIKAIMK